MFSLWRTCEMLSFPWQQVKNNQLSMTEAEYMFREWQMRYSDGKSPSFKQKQV